MKKYAISLIIIILPLVIFSAGTGLAQGIKERMKDRLPVIIELKNKGILGENSEGYLEYTGSNKERPDTVASENRDRKTIYEAIAKREGSTEEFVGKKRAQQIAEKADPGDWLKNEKGEWYQK